MAIQIISKMEGLQKELIAQDCEEFLRRHGLEGSDLRIQLEEIKMRTKDASIIQCHLTLFFQNKRWMASSEKIGLSESIGDAMRKLKMMVKKK